MQVSLKMGLGRALRPDRGFDVFSVLGAREGFAIDFVGGRMVVNDSANPANAFDGDPQGKLTVYGADPWLVDPVKGLDLSAARDFGVAMATAAFPYDPSAIHVYVRYTLNAADSTEQRYLFMVDNADADRFAMYTTSGAGFRFVTGDGVVADTETSTLALAGNVEYRTFFGADANGRSWVDDGGVQTDDQLMQIAAAVPAHVGLGGYPDQVLRGLDGYLAEVAVVCGDVALEKRLTQAPFERLYAAEGDSHTFNVSFGLAAADFYPARVAAGVAAPLAVRNGGGSGESSAQMLAQVSGFLAKGVPDVATIYAGSNDVDTVVSVADTASSFAVGDVGKMAVGGYIRVGGETRKVVGIAADVLTLDAPLSVVPAAGDAVSIDTRENILRWVQALQAARVGEVAVIGSHYLNFPSAGDTPDAEQSLRGAVRVEQRAAATAAGVPYVDTYAHMRGLIVAGQVAQGDWAAWHQGESDTHLNATGEQVLADAVRAALFV